jgi:hypothetical protein
MSESNFFVSSKPPKFKKVVLSYDSHAKHFVEQKKALEIKTQPENVFDGYKKVNKSVRKSSQKSKTSNRKTIKKKKKVLLNFSTLFNRKRIHYIRPVTNV